MLQRQLLGEKAYVWYTYGFVKDRRIDWFKNEMSMSHALHAINDGMT